MLHTIRTLVKELNIAARVIQSSSNDSSSRTPLA